MDDIIGWFAGRLPAEWYEGQPQVSVDREEIVVVGSLPAPDTAEEELARRAGEAGRIARFREDTREVRMRIADEAEARFRRKVAWGASCGETRTVFTNRSVPLMTRLRQPERQVLDQLVEAGVARSRSDALAWCVRLVGKHEADWLARLGEALSAVREARAAGPMA